MSYQAASQPQSSHAESPTEEPPKFDHVAIELFRTRCITDLEPDESNTGIDICILAKDILDLFAEVQQTCHKHEAMLVPEVELRQEIDGMMKYSLRAQKYTTSFLLVLMELAIDFDSISGRDGFRTFMRSHFMRRFCQAIYERQLDARCKLAECKLKLHRRTKSELIMDDFGAVAYYMSQVSTYFNREYKKYAMTLFTEKPTEEDIAKLSGMVFTMCFHGVKSIGRLFAHGQVLRKRLEAFEDLFQKIWEQLPINAVDKICHHLTFVRDVLHSTRQSTMILIGLAMRFVHDDDDQFISYCREQEERIAQTADSMYIVQDQIDALSEMMRDFTNNFSDESTKRLVLFRSTISGDPLEKYMTQLGVHPVEESYNVFLVHDGSEGCLEMAYYLQSEIHRRGFSCYLESRKGLISKNSKVLSEQTERTLDDAMACVFLLTPELAKRKRSVSYIKHMINRVRTARVGWPGPSLIPVFFEVSITDCRTRNIFGESSEAVDDDIEKADAEKAFHFVTRYTGIENLEGAKLGNGEEVNERCERLMTRTADGVAEVLLTKVKEFDEHMQQEHSAEISEEGKAEFERISRMIEEFRGYQREAREEAFLQKEREPFRSD